MIHLTKYALLKVLHYSTIGIWECSGNKTAILFVYSDLKDAFEMCDPVWMTKLFQKDST